MKKRPLVLAVMALALGAAGGAGAAPVALAADPAPASASSGDAATQTLTYQQAVESALSKSYKVKNALEDIDRSREVLDKAADSVWYVSGAPGGDPYVNKAYLGYESASVAYQVSKKIYELTKDTVAYAVKQAYNGVLQAEEKKRLAEATLQNADIQRRIAQVRYEYGLISRFDRDQAEKAYQTAQANLAAAEQALADAYQRLNQLVGLPPEARYVLVDRPEVKDLGEVDLRGKVAQVQAESPAIWQAEQQVNLAKLQLDLYTFNDPTNPDPYQAKEIDVRKASNTLLDLKDQLEATVRSLYATLEQLRSQYDALQSQLAAAEDSLKLVQVQYANGMAIWADVVAAQTKVQQLRQQLADVAAQYDNLLMAFDKPWVYGGAAASQPASRS